MAVDFFRSIGMTSQAETVMEIYPGKADDTATSVVISKKPKPVSRPLWIGAGIFSFMCLFLLGAGALGLRSFLPSLPRSGSTETVSPTAAAPATTAVLPVTGDLPSADGMVKIPADTYEVGTILYTDNYHVNPQKISLDSFWIDQYQTTNAKYQKFIAETNTPPPVVWPGDADHPVRGVTWDQAVAYCTWAKKRLPTEAEWEASGRGSGEGVTPQMYPWGNDDTAGGQTAAFPDQDTYAIGTLSFNKSPFGVYDLVGNVWEWVGEPYAAVQDGYKFLHGGRFGLPVVDLAYRLAISPGDTRYIKFAGFRCAANEVR